jgi:hypothetical protein
MAGTSADALQGTLEQGTVEIDGQQIFYDLYAVDARTSGQRELDASRGQLAGNVVVLIPGHGQTANAPRKLAARLAQLSKSKVAWSIDITPAGDGDPVEGRALGAIVRERLAALFHGRQGPGDGPEPTTLIGWSHGGGESIRAAALNPGLFPQVAGLCPTCLVERTPWELLYSFVLEALRILWRGLSRLDGEYLKDAWRVGSSMLVGIARDCWRTRSLRRAIDDIRWACRKVPGKQYGYGGEVAIIFGRQDSVIRWHDVFPQCERPDQIPGVLPAYKQDNFPQASRLEVRVIEGDHLGPECEAPAFASLVLGLQGQLDEAEPLNAKIPG